MISQKELNIFRFKLNKGGLGVFVSLLKFQPLKIHRKVPYNLRFFRVYIFQPFIMLFKDLCNEHCAVYTECAERWTQYNCPVYTVFTEQCIQCALSSVHSVHCPVYTVCTVKCTLCAQSSVHSVHCQVYAMYTVQCTQCALYSAPPPCLEGVVILPQSWAPLRPGSSLLHYTVHYALYTVHFTLYTVHCTLYTVQFALCNIHYTLHTVHNISSHTQTNRQCYIL